MGVEKSSKTAMACRKNFVSGDMLKEIISCANKYIETSKITYRRERNAKTTSEKEIKAVIGFLYFSGVFKSGCQSICDLRNNDGTGIQIFHTTMSLARFSFFLQVIRFDDIATRNSQKNVINYLLSERFLTVLCLTVRKHTVCLPM